MPKCGDKKTSSVYLTRGVVLLRLEVLRVPLTYRDFAQEGIFLEFLRWKVRNHLLGGDASKDHLNSLPHPIHQTVPLYVLPLFPLQLAVEYLNITSSGRWDRG